MKYRRALLFVHIAIWVCVIIFIATSCGPSVEEMAAMEKAIQDSTDAAQKAMKDSIAYAQAANKEKPVGYYSAASFSLPAGKVVGFSMRDESIVLDHEKGDDNHIFVHIRHPDSVITVHKITYDDWLNLRDGAILR